MLLQRKTFSSLSTARRSSGAAVAHRRPFQHLRRSSVVVQANPFEDAINSLTVSLKNSPINAGKKALAKAQAHIFGLGCKVALKNSPINAGKKALAKAQAGEYDAAATRAKIEQYIKDNKVIVFSWSGCPFCKNAKGLLADVGADFKALELDTLGQEGKAFRAELAEMTDRTSVPNIWIAGQNVGGCNDGPGVMTLHKEGKLVPMLKQAGALA